MPTTSTSKSIADTIVPVVEDGGQETQIDAPVIVFVYETRTSLIVDHKRLTNHKNHSNQT